MKNLITITLFSSALCLVSVNAYSKPKRVGLGLTLFGPTGISAKYRITKSKAYTGALAISTNKETQLLIHATYLRFEHNTIKTDAGSFGWYYGYGVKLRTYKNGVPEKQKVAIGPRVPVGLHLPLAKYSFDLFTELSLTLNVVPSTDTDFDFAVGGRVFF